MELTRIHTPISDPQVQHHIDQYLSNMSWDQMTRLQYQDYDLAWRTWLTASSHNDIRGLDAFQHSCFCAGTTPIFGSFVARNHKRRVRVSKDDFMITGVFCKNYDIECVPLEDDDLDHNDCMVMSLPFSANGTQHASADRWLDQAERLEIPVLLDAAYFGISHGVQYPLQRSCVQELAFSLSKNYVGKILRLGIRFSREKIDDSLSAAQLGSDIFDRMGATVAISLLQRFSHNWFVNKYKTKSDEVCRELNLIPTNTLTLALGGSEFDEFKRGDYNRVCISSRLS